MSFSLLKSSRHPTCDLFLSAVVHGRRPQHRQQRSSPAHLHPHEPFPPTVLLLTVARQSSCSLFKNTFVLIISKLHCQDDDLNNARTEEFQFHTCSPRQGCLSLQQILPYSHLDFSLCFVYHFKLFPHQLLKQQI